jgi:hypothetical protein
MINKDTIDSLELGYKLVNELDLLYAELKVDGYESSKTEDLIKRSKKSLQKSKKKVLETLYNAGTVCKDCGKQFGVYSVGCSSTWEGQCSVCRQTKFVTESRDYAYLVTGMRRISRTLKLWNDK